MLTNETTIKTIKTRYNMNALPHYVEKDRRFIREDKRAIIWDDVTRHKMKKGN